MNTIRRYFILFICVMNAFIHCTQIAISQNIMWKLDGANDTLRYYDKKSRINYWDLPLTFLDRRDIGYAERFTPLHSGKMNGIIIYVSNIRGAGTLHISVQNNSSGSLGGIPPNFPLNSAVKSVAFSSLKADSANFIELSSLNVNVIAGKDYHMVMMVTGIGDTVSIGIDMTNDVNSTRASSYRSFQNYSQWLNLKDPSNYNGGWNFFWDIIITPSPAVISSFSPSSGTIGSIVTVTGSNFGPTQGTSIIKFGTVIATSTSWSDTLIRTSVPEGVSGQVPISLTVAGNSVSTSSTFLIFAGIDTLQYYDGNTSGTALAALSQTIGYNGFAERFTPLRSGKVIGMAFPMATISGTGSLNVSVQESVPGSLGGIPSNIPINDAVRSIPLSSFRNYSWAYIDLTSLDINVVKAKEYHAVMTITGSSGDYFTAFVDTTNYLNSTRASIYWNHGNVLQWENIKFYGAGWNFFWLILVGSSPSITSFSPPSGSIGSTVTISGSNFGTTQGTSSVKFGSVMATPTSWSDTLIRVPVPSGVSGSVTITVTVNGMTAAAPTPFTASSTAGPIISIPGTLAFGSVDTGASMQKPLTIGNTGTAPLSGTITVPLNSGFSLSTTSLSVSPGATQDVLVTFSPLASQDYNASVTVTHNAAGSPSVVALSGTGKKKQAGPSISLSRASLLILKNETTGTLPNASVTVTNNGGQPLTGTVSYSGTAFCKLATDSMLSVAGSSSVLVTIQQNTQQTLAPGIYTGAITIRHNAAGGSIVIPVELRIVVIPQSIDLAKTITFSAPSDPLAYQLVSIPGSAAHSAPTVLSGEYKTDWRIYRDNGGASNFFVEYDGTPDFAFGPGRGFWVLSRKGFSVAGSVASASSTSGAFAVNLQPGWNIISNPYERTVAWRDVQKVNGLDSNTILHEWKNGQWIFSSAMVPYGAYYYGNVANASSIAIPYDQFGSASKLASEGPIMPYISKRAIHLTLLSNGEEAASVYAGFDSTSSTDYDAYDYFAPPTVFASASMVIENDAPHMPLKRLVVDHRADVGKGQDFTLRVQNHTKSIMYLQSQGMNSMPGDEVYLHSEQSRLSFNLKKQDRIPIPPAEGEVSYHLLIGTKAYLEKSGIILAPSDYVLYQNYPNPFNPSTTIRYGLPSASRVSVKIYNTLGQHIADLVNAEKSEGWHEILWSAAVPTGVYFYRIEAVSLGNPNTRFVFVRKMMLLK